MAALPVEQCKTNMGMDANGMPMPACECCYRASRRTLGPPFSPPPQRSNSPLAPPQSAPEPAQSSECTRSARGIAALQAQVPSLQVQAARERARADALQGGAQAARYVNVIVPRKSKVKTRQISNGVENAEQALRSGGVSDAFDTLKTDKSRKRVTVKLAVYRQVEFISNIGVSSARLNKIQLGHGRSKTGLASLPALRVKRYRLEAFECKAVEVTSSGAHTLRDFFRLFRKSLCKSGTQSSALSG